MVYYTYVVESLTNYFLFLFMETKKLMWLDWTALVLVIVGGLNWGLVGLFGGFDLVAWLFGAATVLSRIVYILVGLSGVYMLIIASKLCKK